MNSYDEDLKVNAFYKTLLEYKSDLENASKKNWIICIPRSGTITEPITKSDIYNHILVPKGSHGQYVTLNNLVINITQNKIEVEGRDDSFRSIQILFNETFYHTYMKYKVYCIEFPLSKHFTQANPISQITNLRDCIDFLWIETYGREVFQKLTKLCQAYAAKNKSVTHLETLKESIERLYHKCLAIPMECSRLEAKAKFNCMLQQNLQLATETFMQHTLNNQIFASICAITAHHDSNFNKATRNLHDIQTKHFPIVKYQERIPTARCELNKINHYITTLGKIQCLKATFDILACHTGQADACPTRGRGNLLENEILNGEVLVQLFAFLIIKLHINNWIANLVYMKEFMFSHCSNQDEGSYLITTLEAAIEYIKSGQLIEKLNSDIDNNRNEVVTAIRTYNLEQLKLYSAKQSCPDVVNSSGESIESVEDNLCHPLCSCDHCERLLSQSQNHHQTCFDFIDEKGRNSLHIACIYGYPQIVDFLLHQDLPLQFADYSGSFPIHYAAQCGHLNPLLLLLHNDADLNVVNADGNTALHLAANNGHENCVKGLLYYSEHQNNALDLNVCNAWGETALHLASKWGYLNIVKILLEYKIDPRIRNKCNEVALDLAHSAPVKKLLISQSSEQDDTSTSRTRFPRQYSKDFAGDTEDRKAFGVRPKNFEQFKKTDLLLKAIENNDLPLSCFYLGIPTSPMSNNNHVQDQNGSAVRASSSTSTAAYHCHPLCDCPLCQTGRQSTNNSSLNGVKLNVNICNSEGFTPLHVAAQFGRNEILRLLLDAGAECDLQTYKAFYTPLHLACINQRVFAIKELLLSGSCSVDVQDGNGNTALHYACSKNDVRILDILLSKGADTSVKNNRGKTAYRMAQERSLFAVAKIIQDKTKEMYSSHEELL